MLEKIKDVVINFLANWLTSKAKIFLVLLLMVPIFGSSLIFSTVFVTKDHQVLYEFVELKEACGNFQALHQGFGQSMAFERNMYIDFLDAYKGKINFKDYFKKNGYQLCRVEYLVNIGNIGNEAMGDILVSFYDKNLQEVFADHDHSYHMFTRLENISAAQPRDFDPIIQKNGANFQIKNLASGAMASIYFTGWFPKGIRPTTYDSLVNFVAVSQGEAEQGSPKATGFGRFFAVFL